ncbi:helix-turn-helix domain-containing protein, partial [Rhodococcoides fascians]|uniref:helix-turn-helix domain-containing protein n=1 Tax=Rhodococcoides fascians TaxID=1828 RepID=UPI001E4934A3
MTEAYEIAGDVPAWLPHDRLEKARRHAGLNQDELAERLGMSRRTVGSYEAGAREPKRPILIAWAMATGVNLRWLETGETPAPTPPGAPSRTRTYDLRIK